MTDLATPLFENAAWAVHADGLEHKGNGYFIERGQLGDRDGDGLWAWPVHMAEKDWCAPEAFAEAFLTALAAFGVAGDARLPASFDAPRLKPADAPGWRRVARRLGLEDAPRPQPITVEPRRPVRRDAVLRTPPAPRAAQGEPARRTA